MQTQINPALAAAMTLERAAQAGEFQPTTPQGQPTVAAQLMQRAMPPAVPDVAQQAGLGAQIQAMQQQQAQQALMQQAMANRPPAGIEGLNPQMGNFAEGGIVGRVPGYAAGELTEDEYDRRLREAERKGSFQQTILGGSRSRMPESMGADERERLLEVLGASAPMMPIPEVEIPAEAPPQQRQAAPESKRGPSTGGLATSSAADIAEMKQGIETLAKQRLLPEPEEGIEAGLAKKAAADEYARRTGNDPEMVAKAISQFEDLYSRQLAKISQRTAEAQERGRAGAIPAFLTNFRQMRGQGIGEGFRTGSEGMEQFAGASRREIAQLEDIGMEIERAKIEKVNALKSLKYNTDMGFFGDAMKDRQRLIDADRALQAMRIKASETAAQIRSGEAQTAAKLRSEEATRLESAANRKVAEQSREMLAAQGRLTEAEKARAAVVEKNQKYIALKDAKDPMSKQMYESAAREIAGADRNVAEARSLYNSILNQNVGIQPSAGVRYAVNPQTGERIMSTDGKTWQPAR